MSETEIAAPIEPVLKFWKPSAMHRTQCANFREQDDIVGHCRFVSDQLHLQDTHVA